MRSPWITLSMVREQKVLPAAVALHDLAVDEKARARDGAARAEEHAGVVEELGLALEPQRIPGRNPVAAAVFGIAVAGDDPMAGAENLVHFKNIVFIEKVVRVKDKITVVPLVGEAGAYFLIEEFQRVALADVLLIETLPHHRARFARDGGGSVRAVVRYHVGVHQLARVILAADAVDKVCDHRLLIARRDKHCIPVLGRVRKLRGLAHQNDDDIHDLIGVAEHK